MKRRTFKALPVKMFDKFSYISFALKEFRIFKPSVFLDSCFLRNRSSREEMTSREICFTSFHVHDVVLFSNSASY